MKRDFRFIISATLSMILITFWLGRHLHDLNLSQTNFAISYSIMFGYLALNMLASLAARPHIEDKDFDYSKLRVDIVVPVYNEDPTLLAAGLESIAAQTRRPQFVWVIDDGSTESPFENIEVGKALHSMRWAGISVMTRTQENAGKRHAQAQAFRSSPADIFVTVDSDTILEHNAVEELLFGFAKPATQSVGGMAVGQNHRASLFTRVVELGFVMAFLSGRLAEGFFGAVRVNCGIIAAYRGDIVRENLDRYLDQRWMGEPVNIGDDRALTIFARERGRTEFQVTAVAYSALPTNLSHLVRQRLRWARSWYWGTLWLLRRPVRTPEFWITVLQVLGMISYIISLDFAIAGIVSGAISPRLLGYTVLLSMAIGATSTIRYVAAGRPDESVAHRLVTWLLSPLSSLLYMFILVPLYWYAGLSLRPRGWGTRARIEVGLHTAPAVGAALAARRPGAGSAA